MQIRPLYDHVVLKPRAAAEKRGSLYIPTAAENTEAYRQGEVLAVGEGRITERGDVRALSVRVGEIVLYPKFGGTEVEIDGERVVVIREDAILCAVGPA
jgi:chaperonin GroES